MFTRALQPSFSLASLLMLTPTDEAPEETRRINEETRKELFDVIISGGGCSSELGAMHMLSGMNRRSM